MGTQEHQDHDNNIDPMEEQIDEGRNNDENIGTSNNLRNIPMETAYNMSDVEKFVRFENSSGENNCWINCVLRALSVMVQWIPNYSNQSQVPMINAFINYVKDMTSINNGTTLDVNSMGIHVEQNSQPLSVKELFSTITRQNEFNSNRQQDAGEGLLLILQYIEELGSTEMNFINPFRFCSFSWRETKTCLNCNEVVY